MTSSTTHDTLQSPALRQGVAREYVIYNVAKATTAKRGADWFRYGTLADRKEAMQMAEELFSSREFDRVEVHETVSDRKTGSRTTRVVKTFASRMAAGPVVWLVAGCLLMAAALVLTFALLP